MADAEPSVRNGPPATTGKSTGDKGGMGVLSKPAGPLPIYGWIAVGVAAIFLYRKLYAAPAAAPQSTTTPSDLAGGVFVIPGAGSTSPAPAPTGAVTTAAGGTVPLQTAIDAIVNQRAKDAQPLTVAGKQFLGSLAKLPAGKRQGAETFLAQNDARKSLGVTYFKGTNSKGIPVLYDPKTGYQTLLQTSGTKKA